MFSRARPGKREEMTMNRPLLGLILGVVLGLFDGSTAFFTAPELRSEIIGIMFGSAILHTLFNSRT